MANCIVHSHSAKFDVSKAGFHKLHHSLQAYGKKLTMKIYLGLLKMKLSISYMERLFL